MAQLLPVLSIFLASSLPNFDAVLLGLPSCILLATIGSANAFSVLFIVKKYRRMIFGFILREKSSVDVAATKCENQKRNSWVVAVQLTKFSPVLINWTFPNWIYLQVTCIKSVPDYKQFRWGHLRQESSTHNHKVTRNDFCARDKYALQKIKD